MASDRAALEAFFETNDIPTQGQYQELIVSVPNIVDDYGSAPAFTRFIRLPFTAPEVRDLNGTPQDLVPAPGAGFFIDAISVNVKLNFVAPVFSSNPTLQFRFPSGNASGLQVPGILNSTGNVFRQGNFITFFVANTIQVVENEALQLFTSSNIAAGGSDIVVYVMYRIVVV